MKDRKLKIFFYFGLLLQTVKSAEDTCKFEYGKKKSGNSEVSERKYSLRQALAQDGIDDFFQNVNGFVNISTKFTHAPELLVKLL